MESNRYLAIISGNEIIKSYIEMWWSENTSFWKYITVILAGIPWMYEAVKYFAKTHMKETERHNDASLNTSNKHEVLMFREDRYECRMHCHKRIVCEKSDCAYKHLSKLCNIIGNAVQSLDVCVCFITCEDLIGCILLASQRGANVRVITDGDMMEFGSQVEILQKYGISMLKVKSSYKMHHKFAIVDNKVLIEGSANWTIQAFTGNWENIIITSHEPLVRQFADMFSELWDSLQEENKSQTT